MEKYVNTARCINSDHVAESGVRAVSLCMMLRQAAGNAAFLAIRDAKSALKMSDLILASTNLHTASPERSRI